jgi:hypothetical protein
MAYGLMGIIEGLKKVWEINIFEIPPVGNLRKTLFDPSYPQ